MNAPQQMPLSIQLMDNARFDNYVTGQNETAVYSIKNTMEQYVFLWGGSGCGKTHLLQALCYAYSKTNMKTVYLPLDNMALSPDAFENLESMDLVCLDNIEFTAGNPIWEEALFNLYNRLRDADTRLVVAAEKSPTGLDFKLADLASRMCWGPVYHLKALKDDEKKIALQHRAKNRGLVLDDNVVDYLLNRASRDMQSLFELLDKLDNASLVAKRKLTVPFVRELL
ncbi:DnaA inactivator Hda (shorter homolog of DnaA) [hydrothermal vent metagenome]|uniref:DnaA inactivator Hda (Shorter homolog of DnaA) n=1 Tax=hydrothermal vent metagenome TaxID=652676 RepID=A0A3B0ZF45_9ZZZZ